jgi:hypothetical protein
MHTARLRLGLIAAVATLFAACANDVTSPVAQNDAVSARGSSLGGGGGGVSGSSYTGKVDSTRIVNVGVYYPSYQDVWYTGSHAFRATTATKIHSSSDVPLQAGTCAQFQFSVSGAAEYTSDIKVLTADKCGV